jgi:hypothetical protein
MAWPRLKRVGNILTAMGKVLTAMGSGIFAVAKTAKWLTNSRGDGLETVWAKGLAGSAVVAAGVTNGVIRVPNMLRERQKKKPTIMLAENQERLLEQHEDVSSDDDFLYSSSDEDAVIEQDHPTSVPINIIREEEIKNEEACCDPGFSTTGFQKASYIFLRVLTQGGYSFYTSLTGYLSAFSISQFVAGLLNSFFPDHVSDKIDDAEWKLWVVHAFAMYLLLSNLKSYLNSNMANILESYLPDLISGKWKEYSWKVYVKVLPYVFVNAVNAKFSLDSTAGLLNQYTLNKISSKLIMSDSFITVFSSVGVVTNVANFSLVNIPSMHNLHQQDDKSVEYAEKVPECYNYRVLFKIAFLGDSVATGAVNSRAMAYSLHQILSVGDQHVATKMCSLVLAGGFVTYNAYASDVDAYKKEMDRRIKEKSGQTASLLSVSASAGLRRNSQFASPNRSIKIDTSTEINDQYRRLDKV